MNQYGEHASFWTATAQPVSYPPLASDLEVDVLIIGAGITGLTSALLLQREGKRVAVIDRLHVAGGTTGTSSAHLTTMTDFGYRRVRKHVGKKKTKLVSQSMKDALDHIERLTRELSIDCGFRRVDGYYYAEDRKQTGKLKREFRAAHEAGQDVEMVERVPLPFGVKAGFRVANQACFNPVAYCNGLAAAFQQDDGQIFTGTEAVQLRDGEPCEVQTPDSTIRARDLIVATHTPATFNPVQAELSIKRSFVLVARVQEAAKIDSLFWNFAQPYEYIRPCSLPDGSQGIVFGGKDHEVGHGDSQQSLDHLAQSARDRFGPLDILYHWSAQFYEPTDQLPMIGRSPFNAHTWIATGFGGDGLTLGTLSAMLITDRIEGRDNPYADLYAPERFKLKSIGEFVHMNLHNAEMFIKDRFTSGPAENDLQPGQHSVTREGGKILALYKDEAGSVHRCSGVCPHMKCVVHWNALEKSWDCPCHGSRFDIDGNTLEGPAVRTLEQRTDRDEESHAA